MSSTRIRYIKQNDLLVSRGVFTTTDGKSVKVQLDVANKKYKIFDAVTSDVVAEGGDTINLNVIKQQAKQALTALGVAFEAEDRAERTKRISGN